MSETDWKTLAEAFRVIGELANLNGRRLERAYLMSRVRVHRPVENDAARYVPMASRRERRQRVRELRRNVKRRQSEMNRHTIRESFSFRPVLGFVGHRP